MLTGVVDKEMNHFEIMKEKAKILKNLQKPFLNDLIIQDFQKVN